MSRVCVGSKRALSPDPERGAMPTPLSSLTTEEVVSLQRALGLSAESCAVARERQICGRLLSRVERKKDLRKLGLTRDVLNKADAKLLLNTVLEMQEDGVPPRFLCRGEESGRQAKTSPVDHGEERPLQTSCRDTASSKQHKREATAEEILPIVRRYCAQAKEKQCYPLYLAVLNGDVEAVRALLKCKYKMTKGESKDVREFASEDREMRANTGRYRESPLMLAAELGHADIASLLIKYKADVEGDYENICFEVSSGDEGLTPLHKAAIEGHNAVVDLLIEHEANIEATCKVKIPRLSTQYPEPEENTPLHYAALNGHFETVALLLTHAADIEAENTCRKTPLHLAAENGHAAVVTLLVEEGANIDAGDENENTPLRNAVENDDMEMASLLITLGADLETINDESTTPLEFAVTMHEEMAFLLISQGASIEAIEEQNGNEALHSASMEGNTAMVSHLLAIKANVNAADEIEQYTPLHFAAQNGCTEIVSLLVNHGANLDAENTNKCSPLHIAARNGHKQIVLLLLSRKANTETKNKDQRTPLDLAAEKRHTEIMSLLLPPAASIDKKRKGKEKKDKGEKKKKKIKHI